MVAGSLPAVTNTSAEETICKMAPMNVKTYNDEYFDVRSFIVLARKAVCRVLINTNVIAGW